MNHHRVASRMHVYTNRGIQIPGGHMGVLSTLLSEANNAWCDLTAVGGGR